MAEELLALAERYQSSEYYLIGHRALGDTLYHLGEFVSAHAHLEQGIALYDTDQHRSYALVYGQDPLMGCRIFAANTLWKLGYPDQALQHTEAAVSWSEQLAHPFSLVFALQFSAVIHARRREWQAVVEQTQRSLALCLEQGFTQLASAATRIQNQALIMQGNKERMAQMRQGIVTRQAIGARTRPGSYAQLADVHRITGKSEEGLSIVVRGLEVSDETGERLYDAELNRLKGELLLFPDSGHEAEAEADFQRALNIARLQQAKSFELRAAMSLSRLWRRQGKCTEARELLAPVYNWFTEGFDTADLKDAKLLLDGLT